MKRHYLLLLTLLAIPAFSQISVITGGSDNVQNKEIDQSTLRITYKATSVPNPQNTSNPQEDIVVLEIGENDISRFYSDSKRRVDSLVQVAVQRNPSNIDISALMKENGISSTGDPREVFTNYPKGKLSVTDHILTSSYIYEEDLAAISWKIEMKNKEILNYSCQKAVGNFRGRHYEAWFTPELPINNGPWKFKGLPGLILEVRDSDNHYVFEAIGIEQTETPILFPEKKYIKTNREELNKIRKRMNDDPMGLIQNAFPGGNVKVQIKGEASNTPDKLPERPYNPIELE